MDIVVLVFILMLVLIFLLPVHGGKGKKMSPAAYFAAFLIALAIILYFLNR